MEIDFEIENQLIKRTDNNVVVNKSRNYLTANFQFISSDWDDVDKFALFRNAKNQTYKVHLGTENYCSCNIPSDVLLGESFEVSVYGGDLITADNVKVVMLHSNYTKNIKSIREFQKDVFIQLFEELDAKFDSVEFTEDNEIIFYSVDDTGELVELQRVDLNLADVAHSGSYEDILDFKEGFDSRMKLWMQDMTDAINEI